MRGDDAVHELQGLAGNRAVAGLLGDPSRASRDAVEVLLGLRRATDDGARTRLLDAFAGKPPRTPGRQIDESTLQEMEALFGASFADVRIHSDGLAAATTRHAGAHAYTTGHHVAFAPGRYDPSSRAGRSLLAHELAHVVQQRRGGSAPALETDAAHERGAETTAAMVGADVGTGTIGVAGASGVGMARSADEWLRGTVDLSTWRYSDLVAERSDLQEWMGRQLATDDNTLKIEEALMLIDARIMQLESGVRSPQRKPPHREKSNKKTPANAVPAAAEPQSEPEGEAPRCLVERSTPTFESPEAMREEFDRIVAWLQRKDVSALDRQILQTELAYLSPLLGQTLHQQAAEKRRARIGAALTPRAGGDARESILEAVRLVESIKPVDGQGDMYYLMHDGEMLSLTKEEAVNIRAAAIAAMTDAVKKVEAIDSDGYRKLQGQLSVDLDNGVAAWGTSLVTDMDTSEAVDRFLPISNALGDATSRFAAARRSGDLGTMAMALADAEGFAINGRDLVNGHLEDIQTSGGKIITGLQITQAAAFTIVMVATAGAAAPVVGAGVAGAGFTGATATTLTMIGTASVVGTEGFALGGFSGTAGQLATGSSLSDSLDVGWQEGKKWGETGVKIGAATVLAPAAAARFGASKEGIGLASQIFRSGAATGTVNLGIEASSRALFHQQLLNPSEAGLAFGGGFLGGAGGPLTQKLANPLLRGAANVAWGAGTSGGLTYLDTRDASQAWQSALLGGASALQLGDPLRPNKKAMDFAYAKGQKVRGLVDPPKRLAGAGGRSFGREPPAGSPDVTGEATDSGETRTAIPKTATPKQRQAAETAAERAEATATTQRESADTARARADESMAKSKAASDKAIAHRREAVAAAEAHATKRAAAEAGNNAADAQPGKAATGADRARSAAMKADAKAATSEARLPKLVQAAEAARQAADNARQRADTAATKAQAARAKADAMKPPIDPETSFDPADPAFAPAPDATLQPNQEPVVWVRTGKGNQRGTYVAEGSRYFGKGEGTTRAKSVADAEGYRPAGTPQNVEPIVPRSTGGRQVESSGAGGQKGRTFISATASKPKAASSTSIQPDLAEAHAYNAHLDQGEYGIQRPLGSNAPGVDSITARVEFDASGRPVRARIFLNDVTTPGAPKSSKPAHFDWAGEMRTALEPGTLDFGDPAIDAVVRKAAAEGDVYVRIVRVDMSPAGKGAVSAAPGETWRLAPIRPLLQPLLLQQGRREEDKDDAEGKP